ncbi:MAG: hypothetical protein N3G18_02925 [Candidatus Saccharicenans sp.]|nr:hypothetical protein [Candidatus Saccharicenans sp.]
MKNKKERKFKKLKMTVRNWSAYLLCGLLILFMASISGQARAEVKPQFGLEGYGGSNKLFVFSPWIGVRLGLGSEVSLIFRYNYHNFRYDYYGSDGIGGSILKTMKAEVHRASGAVYFSRQRISGYINLSYLAGSDGYRGYLADSGLEYRFNQYVAGLWSVYSIREKSVLWHPEEIVRWINTYSMRFGMKFWLVKGLVFNPNLYLMKNSEEVEGLSYSVGLIYSPNWWMAIHAYYFRYGESAFYVFHGNYFSFGLNFYY